jgi:hypothetical protein
MSGGGAASGALSGFGAGLISGLILHATWILTPLALLVASKPNVYTGWVIHLVISTVVGAVFGAAIGRRGPLSERTLVAAGLGLGVLVFAVGPLTLIPMAIGLPPQFAYLSKWLKVGAGYLVYGALTGAFCFAAQRRVERRG